MSYSKVSFEETLEKSVVGSGKCVGCGACVIVCPFNCLEYIQGKPRLIEECKTCGICAGICPQYEWSWPKAESFTFGRERKVTEEFGVYRQLVVAKAERSEVLKACQDGGIATALLLFALEDGLIDSAIVSGVSQEKPFFPVPRLAVTPEEILECAGTRYSYSPNILALTEGFKQKRVSVAFVGTPCQIRAIRKMQMLGLRKYIAPIKFLIGLMCSESFTYEGLMERHIQKALGINLNSIKKMNIKGKMFVTTNSGVENISLAEVKQFTRKSCEFCNDFSSELADISIGGLGLDGWTFTIIRTKKGEELFSKAEEAGIIKTRDADEETYALRLLRKLSKKKKQRFSEREKFIHKQNRK